MNIAAILAGGIGSRVGSNIPKQFIEINGIPMIVRTISAFENHDEIDAVLIVCLKEWEEKLRELIDLHNIKKVNFIAYPGDTRRESSLNAINALKGVCSDNDIILIHDAARPNISSKVISDNIRVARETGACETVIPVQDTILMSMDGEYAHEIPPRERLYTVQTPQSFKYKVIREAHLHYSEQLKKGHTVPSITDDAGLLLYANTPVSLVIGDKFNLKVTSPEDVALMEAILK